MFPLLHLSHRGCDHRADALEAGGAGCAAGGALHAGRRGLQARAAAVPARHGTAHRAEMNGWDVWPVSREAWESAAGMAH